MKTRLFAAGLACLAAGLVACGGGGGGGSSYNPPAPSTPVPTQTPVSTPTPAPTPTNNPYGCVGQPPFTTSASFRRASSVPHPIASGDTFTYAGTLKEVYAQSAPCPQLTSTDNATATVTVSSTAAPAPAPTPGAMDRRSIESDAFATLTQTTTTDQIVANSAAAYRLFSTTTADNNGNSIVTAYATPQILDVLPESKGQTWSNDPAASITEALADGSNDARTLAADGTYTDTFKYPNGVTDTVTIPDLSGAGTYDLAAGTKCGGEVDFAYAAPSGGNIVLTITTYSTTKAGVCVPGSKTRTFPQWFTPPSSPTPSYVTDTFQDSGTAAVDPACGTLPVGVTSGEQITETSDVLDPVLGYTDKRVTTSYVAQGYGPVCVTISDTLSSYYDYSSDTTRIDYQSENGRPNSVDTITEALGMQSAACAGGGSAPCAAERRAASVQGVSPVAVAAHVAAIEHYRAVQRAQRLLQLHRFAEHLAGKGVLQ